MQVRLRTLALGAAAIVVATVALSGHGPAKPRLVTTLHDAVLVASSLDSSARFLQVTGYTGGTTTDQAHPGLVNVDDLRVGLTVPTSTGATGRAVAGKGVLDKAVLTKDVDAYSSQFLRTAGLGGRLKTVQLFVQRPGETPYDIVTYMLNDVLVTHVVDDAHGNETVVLVPRQVCITYLLQKPTGGFTSFRTCYEQSTNHVS